VAKQVQGEAGNVGGAAEQEVAGVGDVQATTNVQGVDVEVAGDQRNTLLGTQPGVAADVAAELVTQTQCEVDALGAAADVAADLKVDRATGDGCTVRTCGKQVAADVEIDAVTAEHTIQQQVATLVDVDLAIGAGRELAGDGRADGRRTAADVAARAFKDDVRAAQDSLSHARRGHRAVGLDADRLAIDVVEVEILLP